MAVWQPFWIFINIDTRCVLFIDIHQMGLAHCLSYIGGLGRGMWLLSIVIYVVGYYLFVTGCFLSPLHISTVGAGFFTGHSCHPETQLTLLKHRGQSSCAIVAVICGWSECVKYLCGLIKQWSAWSIQVHYGHVACCRTTTRRFLIVVFVPNMAHPKLCNFIIINAS